MTNAIILMYIRNRKPRMSQSPFREVLQEDEIETEYLRVLQRLQARIIYSGIRHLHHNNLRRSYFKVVGASVRT
jgi:hypothetical protein